MKILIPNASSPKNVGDQAMLDSLFELLKFQDAEVVIHTYDPELMPPPYDKMSKYSLYSWTVFQNPNVFIRVGRLAQLLYNYLCLRGNVHKRMYGKSESLIADYLNADVIVFAPGGYLRSRPGITQSLNLIMLLVMFWFARSSKALKIVAPISFGPFAYGWQKKLALKTLKDFGTVMTREDYSYNVLKEANTSNLVELSDLALLHYMNIPKKTNIQPSVIGFTIRNWLPKDAQEELENHYIDALGRFSKLTGTKIQPLIQVDAPEYDDRDLEVTKKIADSLIARGLPVMEEIKILDVDSALKIYKGIDLLLGMRMHSNILAATQGTPFVAISYEYKTEGICASLGVSEYVIGCHEVNADNLFDLLYKLNENHALVADILNNSLKKIKAQILKGWNEEVKYAN